jgi:hypothetical protein
MYGLVRKAADEIKISIFFQSFEIKKVDELVTASYKLANNFAGLVTSVFGSEVARRLPVVLHCHKL